MTEENSLDDNPMQVGIPTSWYGHTLSQFTNIQVIHQSLLQGYV